MVKALGYICKMVWQSHQGKTYFFIKGMMCIVNNQEILSRLDIDGSLFTIVKFFTADFFGALKVLNIHLFNFQFVANGEVYSTAKEFFSLTSTTFPNVSETEIEALTSAYKERLLALWMAQNGVSMPPKEMVKAFICGTLAK